MANLYFIFLLYVTYYTPEIKTLLSPDKLRTEHSIIFLNIEQSMLFFCTGRVHAEFQLNEEPNFPFWFTPAQFSGRLIMDREGEHIEYFEMALPANKQLNIGQYSLQT